MRGSCLAPVDEADRRQAGGPSPCGRWAYSGSSTDLPARVVSPYYSEAARFPAPEGTGEGRVLFGGGVPPIRVLPGGSSVVVTCGRPVDGSLADSQLFVGAEVGGQITNLGACMSWLRGAAAQGRVIDLLVSCRPGAKVDLTVYTIDRDDQRAAMVEASETVLRVSGVTSSPWRGTALRCGWAVVVLWLRFTLR